jgi:demethylmenaquinone methyltransferase/2-methoxy-6-polyprenyl-1,4-benzoquinol methylase
MTDPRAVNSMFTRIAHRYDLANRLLSAGIDTYWRSRLVSAVSCWRPRNVLDIATGSGDVALALARSLRRSSRIYGIDFCEPMLERAEGRRVARPKLYGGVEFMLGDAASLPFADSTFDAVTVAFGLRNFADRARCLSEAYRVLLPGGRLYILEFSRCWGALRPAYTLYLRRILPALAGFITGDRRAYEYLGETIDAFPGPQALAEELHAAGFFKVWATRMTAGIVALHQGQRQPLS